MSYLAVCIYTLFQTSTARQKFVTPHTAVPSVLLRITENKYNLLVYNVPFDVFFTTAGFRYELYCAVKSSQTPHCVVSLDFELFFVRAS